MLHLNLAGMFVKISNAFKSCDIEIVDKTDCTEGTADHLTLL